jgi:hypothetical protein
MATAAFSRASHAAMLQDAPARTFHEGKIARFEISPTAPMPSKPLGLDG